MAKLTVTLSNSYIYTDESKDKESGNFLNPINVSLFGSPEIINPKKELIIGEVTVQNATIDLDEKIETVFLEKEEKENPFLKDFYKTVQVTIKEDEAWSLPADARILFSMRSDLFKDEHFVKELDEQHEDAKGPAAFICSQLVSIEDDDEPEEFEYFILPESKAEDAIFPESIKETSEERWHFTYDESSAPVGNASINQKSPKKFIFRIYRLNALREKAEKIYNRLKDGPEYSDSSENDLLDATISELKIDKDVAAEIKSSYAIKIYRPNSPKKVPFEIVDDGKNRIDPTLKTLILVPGTFKKSITRKKNLIGKKKWQGSFKYLMKKTNGYANWFEYLLDPENSDFRQIITLEHNSVFDSMQDNMRYFIDHLNISKIRFEQPTAVVSASRGGFLAKMMARVGAGYDEVISPNELNLNIDRVITVATGFSGFLESSNKDVIKEKLELLFNLINIISFGGLKPFAGLLSFSHNFILRLPGLRAQTSDSDEIKRLKSKNLDNLWCLPLANDVEEQNNSYFIKKVILNQFLGTEHDFVVEFNSQKEVAPGQLLPTFSPLIGKQPHGKGLKEEQTRKDLLPFLKASHVSHVPTDPA